MTPELSETIYDALHRLAEQAMQREAADHTLQPTAVVHEAFLSLAPQYAQIREEPVLFKVVAAKRIREILIDHARRRSAIKRGGAMHKHELDERLHRAENEQQELLDLHIALERLETVNPREARVVELRYFGGLTLEEAARELGCSRKTVDRDWRHARAWLRRELSGDAGRALEPEKNGES